MVMIILILAFVLVVTLLSENHGLGLWIFMLITHGIIVDMLGPIAVHLPMYCGGIVVAITVMRGKWSVRSASTLLSLLILATLIALAALTGNDPAVSFERLFAYAKAFVLAIFIGGAIVNVNQIRAISIYIISAVFVGVIYAYYQELTGDFSFVRYTMVRAAGLAKDPNETAMTLLCGLPLVIYWLTHAEKIRSKILLMGVLILIVGAVALTQSRGGGLALIFVSTLLFLRRPSIKTFAVGAVLLPIVLFVITDDYVERMSTVTELGSSGDASLENRLYLIEVGIEIFIRNPMLGVGIGNYGSALSEINSKFDASKVAHNMYLEFFVENGLFAGILLLTILISALWCSMKFSKTALSERGAYDLGFCFAMSLVSVLTAALFLSVGSRPIIWILVAICGAFSNNAVKNSAESWGRSRTD